MRAAVEGDWSFTITPDGGTATQVTLHVDEATTAADADVARASGRGLLRVAYACGTRTLVKSAEACADRTQPDAARADLRIRRPLFGRRLSLRNAHRGRSDLYHRGRRSGQLTIGPNDIESMLSGRTAA
jgi:hypothetical protein